MCIRDRLVECTSIEDWKEKAKGHKVFVTPHHMGYQGGYRGYNWKCFTEGCLLYTSLDTIEKMIVFYANVSFPDYTNPCFSDAKLTNKKEMLWNKCNSATVRT